MKSRRTVAAVSLLIAAAVCADTRGNESIRFPGSDADRSRAGQNVPSKITSKITILHLNDLHGHVFPWHGWDTALDGEERGGLDRIATAVDRVRAEGGSVLLLDAGDTIGDSMEARVTRGSVVVEAMNAIGFDAMTIGNHEPDFTVDVLAQRRDEARFSFLAANLRKDDGSYLVRPYVLRQLAGVTVGIIGLAYPNTALTTASKNVKGVVFSDAIRVAQELVPRMRREGADIIVALTHLGLSHDQELARSVEGIDVIVGGHSHNRMTEAEQIGSTLIVQSGAHGSDLGRLDLELAEGRVVGHRRELIAISTLAPKDDVRRLLLSGLEPSRKQREESIGRATSAIIRAQTIAGQKPEKRDAESPADSLFADLVRAATRADVVLLPGVGYGVAIQPGTIQARHLRNLLPHDSKLSEVHLTAAELRSVLERAIENVVTTDVREKVGGMIQVSGLEFGWRAELPFGQRVVALRVGGGEPAADRRYRVVVNGLLAEGGHRQTLLSGKEKKEIGDLYELVAREIARRGSVTTPPPGRIRKVSAPPSGMR